MLLWCSLFHKYNFYAFGKDFFLKIFIIRKKIEKEKKRNEKN